MLLSAFQNGSGTPSVPMPGMTTGEIFESIFAGYPALTVISKLDQLPQDERQTVLCTICAMRKEIAANSESHAVEALRVLTAGCPSFVDLTPTCNYALRFRI